MIKIKDGRTELYQWDTGSVLVVADGIDEVHFAVSPMGRSITVAVVNGEAKVEDILLQTPCKLRVWGFVGEADNGYTKVERIFTVRPRNKPADYVFTPPEQLTLKDIADKVDALEEKLENDSDEDITAENIKTALGYTPADAEELNSKLDADKLPEAVNDALAQAKESGEFDGKTPVKSVDYFTPEEVAEIVEDAAVRAAELVDVPEGGGGTDTSLGITGAAVGQIPQVSAVDESGKPIAWLPADFPSGGGGKWNLLREVTLEEDVESIIFDLEQPIEEAWIKIYGKAVNSNGTAITSAVVNGSIEIAGSRISTTSLWGGNNFRTNCTYAKLVGGAVFMLNWTILDTSNAVSPAAVNNVNSRADVIQKITIKSTYNFVSNVGDVGKISAGTKVEVWGR